MRYCRACPRKPRMPAQQGRLLHSPPAMAVPICCFAHLHINLMGPLPKTAAFPDLFTIMGSTTRGPEAVPLPSTTAATRAASLHHNLIQRFGGPETQVCRAVQEWCARNSPSPYQTYLFSLETCAELLAQTLYFIDLCIGKHESMIFPLSYTC